jgi:endonuclease YncB( thermonuclease family)
VRLEKYAGRVLAHAQTSDGVDISKYMIEKGLARPYFGKKRQPWCL